MVNLEKLIVALSFSGRIHSVISNYRGIRHIRDDEVVFTVNNPGDRGTVTLSVKSKTKSVIDVVFKAQDVITLIDVNLDRRDKLLVDIIDTTFSVDVMDEDYVVLVDTIATRIYNVYKDVAGSCVSPILFFNTQYTVAKHLNQLAKGTDLTVNDRVAVVENEQHSLLVGNYELSDTGVLFKIKCKSSLSDLTEVLTVHKEDGEVFKTIFKQTTTNPTIDLITHGYIVYKQGPSEVCFYGNRPGKCDVKLTSTFNGIRIRVYRKKLKMIDEMVDLPPGDYSMEDAVICSIRNDIDRWLVTFN
nr:MAG TPA: hypothetical protein [Caudoviricetes sp.]